jgi:hypothetical protein
MFQRHHLTDNRLARDVVRSRVVVESNVCLSVIVVSVPQDKVASAVVVKRTCVQEKAVHGESCALLTMETVLQLPAVMFAARRIVPVVRDNATKASVFQSLPPSRTKTQTVPPRSRRKSPQINPLWSQIRGNKNNLKNDCSTIFNWILVHREQKVVNASKAVLSVGLCGLCCSFSLFRDDASTLEKHVTN